VDYLKFKSGLNSGSSIPWTTSSQLHVERFHNTTMALL